ncbi:hypothetical protein ACFYM0_32885 [Streptomyces sp. NPDC006487]|uniref:hypothetical protein n=1 Tax=Streptomyces sp. NPDC006487 TaxID=3364748 RepID=UPI0036CAE707
MTLIEDLYTDAAGTSRNSLEWDPLREADALQEAGLIDCRVCPLTGRTGLLLDMRTALHYRTGNAALLVVSGLHSFQWSEQPLERDLLPFTVMSSTPMTDSRTWRMEIGLFPDGRLAVAGARAEFHLFKVEGIPDGPPDYMGRRLDEVRHELPWWDSACAVLQASTSAGADASK